MYISSFLAGAFFSVIVYQVRTDARSVNLEIMWIWQSWAVAYIVLAKFDLSDIHAFSWGCQRQDTSEQRDG